MRKFAILFALLCAAAVSARAQTGGLTVEMALDQDQYLPDEDLQVKVTITNRSGQPILLGTDKHWITFDVTGENQYIAPKLGDMPVMSPFLLQSGQSVTREFNPTPYFGFHRAGRYTLGATIKVPQWKKEIPCKPVRFTVTEGKALTDLGDLSFGAPLPPGVTNAAPEVWRYSLLRVTYMDHMKLYFRLTDSGGRTLRVFPLARVVDFREPSAQIDRANNLHVLAQTGAHVFTYFIMAPNGNLLARQYHEFTDSRPSLRVADDGQIFVGGGRRLLTVNDFPSPAPATAKSQ